MSKVDEYKSALSEIDDWDAFLLEESCLPGPRANIELAMAAAAEGGKEWFDHLLTYNASVAPSNTPQEFLAFCGVLGQGKLLKQGHLASLQVLREFASDSRWRVREAVAMALQEYGRSDINALLEEMKKWSEGSPLVRRAAAAGLCEPGLLSDPAVIDRVVDVLDTITRSFLGEENRRSDDFRALRKCLGYCWSVAVAARPSTGKLRMERWFESSDPDIRWIMRQNLRKKRLQKVEPQWTAFWLENL